MVLVSCWKVKIYAHEKSLALKSGSFRTWKTWKIDLSNDFYDTVSIKDS